MRKLVSIVILLLSFTYINTSFAATATRYFVYQPESTVTNINLNGNLNNLLNVINALDSNNVATGFKFIEILASNPSAGNQGRVIFNTTNNTLNFDTGVTYLATALLANTQTFTGNNTFSGTMTFSGNSTFAGTTIADLGTVTTANIDGGTLDGVQIGGTTSTGELIVNNASDDADGLGSQGTSGQFLQSAGAGVNPTWANESMDLISTTTHAGTTNTGNIAISPSKQYYVTMDIESTAGTDTTVSLRFNSSSTATGYAWAGSGTLFHTTPTITTVGDDSDSEISLAKAGGYVVKIEGTDGIIKGQFYLDTNKFSTVNSAFVNGSFVAINGATVYVYATFGGISLENLTITDFELVFGHNCAFTIKLYELK